jgi:hypothetical protein
MFILGIPNFKVMLIFQFVLHIDCLNPLLGLLVPASSIRLSIKQLLSSIEGLVKMVLFNLTSDTYFPFLSSKYFLIYSSYLFGLVTLVLLLVYISTLRY